MQPQQETEFIGYINLLIDRTNESKMTWLQHNPTTYIWKPAPNQNIRLIIQRTSSSPLIYSFQAIDQNNETQMSVINVSVGVNQTLHRLFMTIENMRDKKSLSFLKSIMP